MIYWRRDCIVEIAFLSSSCSVLIPTNTVEPVLCRDDVVVGDDDDANLTDFISSILLPKPALILDGRRDEWTSSAPVVCRSLTNSSVILKKKK